MTTGRINQVAAASERGVQPGAAPQEPPLSVSDKFRGAGWPDGGLTQNQPSSAQPRGDPLHSFRPSLSLRPAGPVWWRGRPDRLARACQASSDWGRCLQRYPRKYSLDLCLPRLAAGDTDPRRGRALAKPVRGLASGSAGRLREAQPAGRGPHSSGRRRNGADPGG